MPKSKRDRAVTLSKTKKKGREHKEVIVNTIRDDSAYVFTFENMNIGWLNYHSALSVDEIDLWVVNIGWIVFPWVMQVALGRSESRPGIYNVSKHLHCDAGLVFTNMPRLSPPASSSLKFISIAVWVETV